MTTQAPLTVIFLTVFIDLLGFGIVLPLLPYYAETFGASPFTIGLLMTSYSVMQLLFTPVWGRLSDRYGRRPLILVSLVGSSSGFLIFGLATTLPWLFAGRIIAGIAGAIIPTANAYVADVTTPQQRAGGMGRIGAAFGLGFILGPMIGGLLSPFGYSVPVLLASAMAGANLVLAYFTLPESLTPETRGRAQSRRFDWALLRRAFGDPRIGPLLVINLVVIFSVANMEATFGLLNEHRYHLGARETGYLFALIGVLMAVAQGVLVGRLARRFGERRLIVLGTFAMIFGLGLMPFAPHLPVYGLVLAVLSFGAGINNPAIMALLSRSAREDEQGSTMGIAQSMSSLGRILGPMCGGYLYGVGAPWPFVAGAACMSLACLLAVFCLEDARATGASPETT